MRFLDPHFATRRRLKAGLVVAGFLAGAVFACVFTRFVKIAVGAPPATLGEYAWNASIFGVMAAFVSPVVTWSSLRRAPLWRTIVEPLALASAGAAVGVLVGSPLVLLALAPAGLGVGYWHLTRDYPEPLIPTQLNEGSTQPAKPAKWTAPIAKR